MSTQEQNAHEDIKRQMRQSIYIPDPVQRGQYHRADALAPSIDELIELPGYVSVPASVVRDVRERGAPICALNAHNDWWIVFRDDRDGGIVTTMPEAEWNQMYPPVLRAWESDQGISYATAE